VIGIARYDGWFAGLGVSGQRFASEQEAEIRLAPYATMANNAFLVENGLDLGIEIYFLASRTEPIYQAKTGYASNDEPPLLSEDGIGHEQADLRITEITIYLASAPVLAAACGYKMPGIR
jgi:hypothetical protein